MALLLWPERVQNHQNSFTDEKQNDYQQQFERTMPGAKYEFATPFNDGMNVALDRDGLLALINVNALRDALYMTTKLLNNIGQGIGMAGRPSQHSTFSLEIWTCRFQLLMALRMHSQLVDELSSFGELDAPDLYMQYYPQFAGQKGSLVPYSLRLVYAEAPSFSPTPYSSVARVHRLEEETRRAMQIAGQSGASEAELAVWQQRLEETQMLRVRVLIRLKEFSKAFAIAERIRDESNSTERRARMSGLLCRMAMQIGDEHRVEKYLTELEKNGNIEFTLHSALKNIFDGNHSQAMANLQAFKSQRPEMTSSDSKFCNNDAICLLYNGKALECLQQLYAHPGPIAEPLALNVATVSDLVSTNSAGLKRSYLGQHGQDRNDLFDPQVLRIS